MKNQATLEKERKELGRLYSRQESLLDQIKELALVDQKIEQLNSHNEKLKQIDSFDKKVEQLRRKYDFVTRQIEAEENRNKGDWSKGISNTASIKKRANKKRMEN